MHRELRKSDIDGGSGNVGCGNGTDGATTRTVCAMEIGLHLHTGALANRAEECLRASIGRITTIGVVLDENATTENRRREAIGVLRVVGMDSVSVSL